MLKVNKGAHNVEIKAKTYSKGVSHYHLCFGRDSKAGRGVGKLHSEKKKGKPSNMPEIKAIGMGKLPGKLTRSEESYVIG